MKLHSNSRTILLALCCVAMTLPAFGQLDLPRPSPLGKVYQRVGMTDVEIEFSRPGVKERTIWGDLVPFGTVWRVGANNATTISFSTDVMINGGALAAGKYAIHAMPGETDWQIMFNKDWDKGGTTYEADKDALVIAVKPQSVEEHVERMTFEIPEVDDNSAMVLLRWEKLVVPFTVSADTSTLAMTAIDEEMARLHRWQNTYNAANYAFSNDLRIEDAVKWIHSSVSMEATWFNTSLQARILAKAGKMAEARAAAKKAIEIGKSQDRDVSSMEELIKELM